MFWVRVDFSRGRGRSRSFANATSEVDFWIKRARAFAGVQPRISPALWFTWKNQWPIGGEGDILLCRSASRKNGHQREESSAVIVEL
jgi:hypothetical protein